MQGYRDFYKIRGGNFRVGIWIDQQSQQVEFQRVLHRKDIYRYFPWSSMGYDPKAYTPSQQQLFLARLVLFYTR